MLIEGALYLCLLLQTQDYDKTWNLLFEAVRQNIQIAYTGRETPMEDTGCRLFKVVAECERIHFRDQKGYVCNATTVKPI